jgi:hypothetical protein
MLAMRALLQPGQFVSLATRPDWGVGQVQSVDGARVTVNFPHAGKVLIQADAAPLTILAEDGEVPPTDPTAMPTTGAR